MMSRFRPALALALTLPLAGCGGWMAALPEGACEHPDWQCITSTPVHAPRKAVDEGQSSGTAATELDRRMRILIASDRRQRLETANGIALDEAPSAANFPRGHIQRYRQLAALASELRREPAALTDMREGLTRSLHYERKWRHSRHTLYLGGKREGADEFRYGDAQAVETAIDLRTVAAAPVPITLSCNGPAIIRQGLARQEVVLNQQIRMIVRPGRDASASLVPADGTSRCELVEVGKEYAPIVLQRGENEAFAALDGTFEVCAGPPVGTTRLEKAFHADRWLSQSCVMPTGELDLLSDAEEGFNAKVEALLGTSLDPAFIKAGNPMAPLDFSQAPRLSLIYASYLDIKADFSGKIFERLLRFHGQRGVPIRILVTRMLLRPKDRALLENLAADHPNIQIQEFAWAAARGAAYDEQAAQLHRTHHVKLLAVLSPQPGKSRAILGGRNLHDGFLYRGPLDLTAFPELHTYKRGGALSLNYYSNYRDFDVAIRDERAVRVLAAHLSTVWNSDDETHVVQPFSVQAQSGRAAKRGMRHFISVPYADGGALERYYVDLIDAAEQSIEIVNPYLNPTPAIDEALRRAVERGVRVTIVARINLHGDLGGTILTELNRLFVEKHADRIEIFEYREPEVVLHAKLLMIDETLSVISSVNLNHRSFLHDSENGIAVLDPDEYRRIRKVFDSYRAISVPLDNARRVPLFYRLLLGNDLLREAL